MSQISQKSISGITSITTPAGIDNQFTLHTNDTSQAAKLDSAGNFHFSNHVNTTGISSASNFKTGSSDLHSTGLSVASIDVDDFVDVGNNIKLGNAGVITATSFVGDGSDLTNLPAGLGTALSATASSPLNKMYYTNQVLGVPSSITVDVPTSASKAYTQYADIKVESSADLIIAEGDDLIPDVLGLADFGTFGGGASAGRIRVNSISNAANDGSPTVQKGLVITGVTTSTTFSGSGASLTNIPAGNLTGTVADARISTLTASKLTGALPAIDGSNLTGLSGVSVANQSDNRLITCTGTTDSLNGEQYLTYTSQSSLNLTDGVGTSNLGGNYLLLKRTTANANYINAPLANADLIISADENLLFHTVHTADFNSTERLRITSQGTTFVKADGTAPVNQAQAGHYGGSGYNAGNALGLMVKRAIHVSDADTKGVGGMFLSHTRNVACNGTTYNMFTLHNREGTFVGDIYVGFSGNSSGAVRKYTFACVYNANNLTSVLFNRRSNNDDLTVNIVSSNTSHFFQVIPTKSGGGTERVSMTIVGAACGRNDGAGGDFYTVTYN